MALKPWLYFFNVVFIVFLCLGALMIDWKYVANVPQDSITVDAYKSETNDAAEIRSRLQVVMAGEAELEKEYEIVNNELLLLKKILADEKIEKEVNSRRTLEEGREVKTIETQNHTIHVPQPAYSDAKELILLVSSLGRGGSSWAGELLSSIRKETMFVFEPLKMVTDIYKTRFTPDVEVEILSRVFSCQFTQEFSKFQKSWPTSFKQFPDTCKGKDCFAPNVISERCRKAQTIVTKTIRFSLENVEELFTRPSFRHLKVIYLARDPRAQVLSRRDVFQVVKNDFTPECVKVESDVYAFHRLSAMFPGQLFFMRYEDMCQDLIGEATQLWKFLQTDSTAHIPDSWVEFLTKHEREDRLTKRNYSYSTYRDSSSQWFKWREEKNVTTESLVNVETLCSNAMDRLGYIPLKTVDNVKNLSLPFVKNYSCDFWNCWSHRF